MDNNLCFNGTLLREREDLGVEVLGDQDVEQDNTEANEELEFSDLVGSLGDMRKD